MHAFLALTVLFILTMLQSGGGDSTAVREDAVRSAALAAAPAQPKQAPARAEPSPADALLASRHLAVPVEGVRPAQLRDTFEESRGKGRLHKAIDIMAPWGTPVLAADDGTVTKISSNRAGGLALFQTDASGRFVYYYAHLAGYAEGLRDGQAVKRGDLIGYVGATGNAPDHAPHLHFAVQLVQSDGRFWKGEVLNPYPALVAGHGVAAHP